ncbi:immunity 22 family protein [Pseudomonas sp.]|uniref:immunity 22 family protein n=1 Tax=Pseudomonas sp. TaxID=306 RepID=UPI003CC62D23
MSLQTSVNIWTALTDWDTTRLQAFICAYYTEDGDLDGSAFSLAVGATYLDDDWIEADVGAPTSATARLLSGFSQDEGILLACANAGKSTLAAAADTAILVYDQAVADKDFTYQGIRFFSLGRFVF